MHTVTKVLIGAVAAVVIGETAVQLSQASKIRQAGVITLRYEPCTPGTEKIYGKILQPDGVTPQVGAQVQFAGVWINNAGGIMGNVVRGSAISGPAGAFTLFESTMDLTPLATSTSLPYSGWRLTAFTTDGKRSNNALISVKKGYNTYIELALIQVAEAPPTPAPVPGPGPV
jgi:hypothetical protein